MLVFSKSSIPFLIYLSFLLSSKKNIIIGFISSLFFGLIESTWKLYNENEFYTSFDQFIINCLILPFSLQYYNYYIYHTILFYPFFLWTIEVFSHIFLIQFFGRNHAWYYTGKYCYFDNSICLKYICGWLFLGLCNYYFYPILDYYIS